MSNNTLNAEEQMALDGELLEKAQEPTLRFYRWKRPAVTFGHFINPEEHLRLAMLHKHGIDYARRPTGGGLLFHFDDFTFSLTIPTNHPKVSTVTLENYHLVNSAMMRAIAQVLPQISISLIQADGDARYSHLCFAKTTKYDLMFNGKKIGGAAQRRTKHALLHQSTLFLHEAPWQLIEQLLIDQESVDAMRRGSGFLSDACGDRREKLEEALTQELKNRLAAPLRLF